MMMLEQFAKVKISTVIQHITCHLDPCLKYNLDILTLEALCADGDIRLAGGTTTNEGRVEVCINHAWGTVCDYHWGTEEADVVCSQLGFLPRGWNYTVTLILQETPPCIHDLLYAHVCYMST